jgi:methyl-accepting chemotaxis protein
MKLRLGHRLTLGIACVSGAIAILYFALMGMLFSRTYDTLIAGMSAKGQAEASTLAASLPFALATDDRKETEKIVSQFGAKDKDVRSVVVLNKRFSEVFATGANQAAWQSVREKISGLATVMSWHDGHSIIAAAPSKSEDDVTGYVVTILSLDDALAQRSRLRNYAIGIFLLGILAIGFVANLLVKRLMVLPLVQTADRLRDIAHGDGDLTQRLQAVTSDEIGELATQFNGFAEKLRELMHEFAGRAEPLAAEANALTVASTSLQRSVDQTVARVTSVESAAETMSSNTETTAQAVQRAMMGLNSIAGAVEEMTASIGEIANNSEKAREVTQEVVDQAKEIDSFMTDLDHAAQAIDKVTETITSISAQTNLLALNATIEAARAGAAGKGFAVVANEIKELAHQTANATEDVKERIRGIQSSSHSALSGNARIAAVIGTINELVGSIATSIGEQATVARDIASNIAAANSGVGEANESMTSNAGVAQSIAKDIVEVTAAANQIRKVSDGLHENSARLSVLSGELRSAVTKFKY